jgi:hypothetical protein
MAANIAMTIKRAEEMAFCKNRRLRAKKTSGTPEMKIVTQAGSTKEFHFKIQMAKLTAKKNPEMNVRRMLSRVLIKEVRNGLLKKRTMGPGPLVSSSCPLTQEETFCVI